MLRTFKRSKLTSHMLLFDTHDTTLVDSLKENPKRFYNHVRNVIKTDAFVDHLITSDEKQISDNF